MRGADAVGEGEGDEGAAEEEGGEGREEEGGDSEDEREGTQQDGEGGGEDGGDDTGANASTSTSSSEPPTVIESFSCAYWTQSDDKTSIASPLLHGRMFVTAAAIYFVGWGKFKLILELEDIVQTRKESTAMGAVDNALLLVCSDAKEYFFGR